MQFSDSVLSTLQGSLALIPDSVRAVILIAVAVMIALIAHRVLVTLILKALAHGRPVLRSIFLQMEGPSRLALALLALNIAVGVAPLEVTLGTVLLRFLQLAFIALL